MALRSGASSLLNSLLMQTFTEASLVPTYSSSKTVHHRLSIFVSINCKVCRFQRPRSLRRRSAAARLLRMWVRIPQGAWMFVCYECRVLSGRGLCNELIIRPEESYRLCCVVVCDLETSRIGAPYIYIYIYMTLV